MANEVAQTKVLHLPSQAGELPRGWDWRRLDDISEGVFDCPHTTPKLVNVGPYVVRSQDIRSGVFRSEQAARVSEDTYLERITRAEPKYGDLLYSREGTYFGIAAEVPRNMRVCLGQRMVLIRPNNRFADSRYLKYWLNSPILAAHVTGHRDGTVAERLNLPTIRALPVPIAPLTQQVKIGDILGTLDDKIELNRRTNETLEAMAKTLFKSWFVDFDPVRMKAAGRQPAGLDAATAKLFPDSFEDSPLGKIPKGWRLGPILEQAHLISGGTPATDEPDYWNGRIPWASAKDVSQCGNPFLIETERSITETGLENSSTKIVPAWTTVIVARGATTGRMTMFGDDIAMNQTCYGLRSRFGTDATLYCQLRNCIDNLVQSAHGSVFDTITTRTFQSSPILLPSESTLKSFEYLVRPIFDAIRTRLIESRTLAATRDALLPKLLNGEVRV